MEFRLLGPIDVIADGRSVPLGGSKPKALLAALLLAHGQVLPMHRLIDIVWGDDPPETARALVQTYVSSLRQALSRHCGTQVIATKAPGYLASIPEGSLDRDVFVRLLAEGRRAAAAGDHTLAGRLLRQAEELWRGPALGGLDSESLLSSEAAQLDELRLDCLHERIGAELAGGRYEALVSELTALTGRHPTDERLRGHLMQALYHQGRKAEALAVYRDARETLINELGVDPGAELTELHQRILRGELETQAAQAAAQELPSGQAPRSETVPAQLPPAPSDFSGRAAEIDALTQPGAPVRIIAGRGGAGKSALAAYVAHRLAPSYPDGQLFAELRGMSDAPAEPVEVLGRFLRALGVEAGRIPESAEERSELLRTVLTSRKMLILLDDARSAAQIRPLVPGNAACTVIVTARDRLVGIPGAQLIDLDVLDPVSAMEMLRRIVGSERVDADPGPADQIIAYCGRLPLAIRIAGSRLATRQRWPLSLLADRLADERRRLDELSAGDLEVRASIGLSYGGLDLQARKLLRYLGHLGVPTFSTWLTAWLLDTSEPEAERIVERLVDAQLIDFVGVDNLGCLRYFVHDLSRLYARGLAETEDPVEELNAAITRVLGGWLSLVDAVAATLPPGEILWPRRTGQTYPAARHMVEMVLGDPTAWFASEQTALVVGVERAAVLGLHEVTCELASARWTAMLIDSDRFDARTRISAAALTAARRAGNRLSEAILLSNLGQLRYDQDRYTEARQHFNESLAIFQELGDTRGEAASLAGLGSACREPGRLAEALHFLDRAAALFADLGDDSGLGFVLRLAGSVRMERGDFAQARSDLDGALAAYQRIGSKRGAALTQRTSSMLSRAEGDYTTAAELSRVAIAGFRALGDRIHEAYAVRSLAKAQIRLGRAAEALPELEWVLQVCRERGDLWGEGATLRVLGELCLAEGRPDAALSYLESSMSIWDGLEVPLMRARTERDLGRAHRLRGDEEQAERFHARADRVFADHGARELFEPHSTGR